ncbi:c-type cytochrome [Myxococcota bacterium]|nr:c-type cytochrome [Myxococcota bacterium]
MTKWLSRAATLAVLAAAAWTCSPLGGDDDPLDGGDDDSGLPGDDESAVPGDDDDAVPSVSLDLPVLNPSDPKAAARGAAWLTEGVLGRGMVPRIALESLWVVWGGPPVTGEALWDAFRTRYGVHVAPFENGDLPLGLRDADGGWVTFDCLVCHADTASGTVTLGTGNSLLDLQGLYDDLLVLAEIAAALGLPEFSAPWEIADLTGAAGANDAFGLAMRLSLPYGPEADIHTYYGYQQAPAFWNLKYKERVYTDGSGPIDGYRTMMATLLASGLTWLELIALDDVFADLQQYLLSMEAPGWPHDPPAEEARIRGRDLFDARCATCHGIHSGPDASFPSLVVDLAEIGTDPDRAEAFGEAEAAWVNLSWIGFDHPMTATHGYLAPPLAGIWATAPYFHNGSVPDLFGVLDSSTRPTRWRRTGRDSGDYDPERVGWRHEVVDAPQDVTTIDGRRVYDTTLPGLSNQGHTYGDDLTEDERSDLVAYLVGL